MKILAIGDPHGDIKKLKKIPKKGVDLFLLTGDLGKADLARKIAFENVERKKKGLPAMESTSELDYKIEMEIYSSSIAVLKYLSKFAPVYFIYGNVEPYDGERRDKKSKVPWFPEKARKIKGVRIINNTIANFNGLRIGGLEYFVDTNWIEEFKPSDYKKKMKGAKRQTKKAQGILNRFSKSGIDILIHHQPPYKVLDKVTAKFAPKHWQGKNAGSKTILNYLKKSQPKYSFCGHIHEGEGKAKIGKTEVYNLGVCGYKIIEF